MNNIFAKILLFFLFIFFSFVGKPADNNRSDTIDILNYKINLDITDFTNKIIIGNCNIKLTPKINNVTEVNFDLYLLNVDSIKVNTQLNTFIYNDTLIRINLLSSLNIGDTAMIDIFYHGNPKTDPSSYGGGFYFSGGYAYNVGVGFAVDPHVFGRAWFPCFDNFVEKSTYDFFITTDTVKKAFCNGLLQNVTDNGNATRTWYWKMGEEIPTYLASVAVADYVTINWNYSGLNGNIPILLNAAANDTTKLKNSFVNLPKALEAYEKTYGRFRFDRVGYNLVPTLGGAMEHASNITYWSLLVDGGLTYQKTMVHELSHHWWGDLATCETAEDMWLNEGWADYSERIFLDFAYGRDAYKNEVRINHENVLHKAHIDDDGFRAVSGVPHDYTYGTTVYDKGSDVIHTLRSYMGDTLFFNCIHSFLDSFAFKSMNSYQFRDFLSSCSGIDLTDYFNNWIFNPGFPHFSIDSIVLGNCIDSTACDVNVFIKQKLRVAPAFYSKVPLEITFWDRNWNQYKDTFIISGQNGVYSATIPIEPIMAALDFDEKISDAITDEYKTIKTTGNHDFGTAQFKITVNSITDSAFVRVEHNWVAADNFKNLNPKIYLSNERYWKVDGILPANFLANASIYYNASSTGTAPYMDIDLFTHGNENLLTLLYRTSTKDDWIKADSFKVNLGSAIDKRGSITIYNLRLGEYALAMDSSMTGIESINLIAEKINLFPNPADKFFKLDLMNPIKNISVEIYNIEGQLIFQNKEKGARQLEINTSAWNNGMYLIKISEDNLILERKKLTVIHL